MRETSTSACTVTPSQLPSFYALHSHMSVVGATIGPDALRQLQFAGSGLQRWGQVPPYQPLDGRLEPAFLRDASYMYMSGNTTLRKLARRRDHPPVSAVHPLQHCMLSDSSFQTAVLGSCILLGMRWSVRKAEVKWGV